MDLAYLGEVQYPVERLGDGESAFDFVAGDEEICIGGGGNRCVLACQRQNRSSAMFFFFFIVLHRAVRDEQESAMTRWHTASTASNSMKSVIAWSRSCQCQLSDKPTEMQTRKKGLEGPDC